MALSNNKNLSTEGKLPSKNKNVSKAKTSMAKNEKKKQKKRSAKRYLAPNSRLPTKKCEKAQPSMVRLEAGKGASGRGGGSGGHYWHIHLDVVRVGYVYINVISEPPFGKHASIQIHINETHRGRGIGRVAYKLACENGIHDEVIATMRKSNLASQRAAAEAGFSVIENVKYSQMAMRWTRKPKS
jgi:hypothetical protein